MKEFKLFRMFPPECSHKKEKMKSYNIEGIGNVYGIYNFISPVPNCLRGV
jgi:hypothetical protein